MSENQVVVRQRRGWLVRVLAWPASALLILATVAAGDAIIRHTPGSEQVSRPFVHSGRIGEAVDALAFAVTVLSVRGGPMVVSQRGETYTTDGVWLLVRVRLTAYTETQHPDYATVRDRVGRIFHASERFQQPLGFYGLQPGVTIEGEILFEVPRDAAPGMSLRMSTEKIFEHAHQTVAEVSLGIDEAMVAGWLARRDPPVLHEPEVVA